MTYYKLKEKRTQNSEVLLELSKKREKTKNSRINFIGVYIFSYIALSAILPFIAQYLLGMGFNGVQIGSIIGFGMLAGVIATPIWGMLCDQIGGNKRVLCILFICPAILSLIIIFCKNYYGIAVLYGCLLIFQNSIYPVTDGLTLKYTSAFGKIRLWGSLGFAIGGFITGIIAHAVGLSSIFVIYSIASVISLLFLINIREEITIPSQEHKSNVIVELMKNKPYIIFIVASIFSLGPISAHNTYFSILYTHAGGNIAGFGTVLMLCIASEAPVMHWMHKLQERFYAETLLIMNTIISMLRWYWYSFIPSPQWIMGTFFVQGLVTGTYITLGLQYVAMITKQENRSTAISVYCSIGLGFGTMICQFLAGIILDFFGAGAIYLFFSLFNLIAVFTFLGLRKVKKTKIV